MDCYKLLKKKEKLSERESHVVLEWKFHNGRQFRFNFDPELKKRHYYIHSGPNTGKTVFARHLLETYRSIICPQNNDWKEIDDTTELVIADEFNGEI